MDRKDKLKIAAASAVLTYIQREAAAPAAMNLWGLSGRQSQMQLNGLMLQKTFHGLRFR